MKVIAHRGASGEYPENTILACEKAFEQGADIVEIDIQITKDAQLVVFHDKDATRVASVNRRMADMTYQEIKGLDVGSWRDFPKMAPPFLEEILERKFPSLIIELKPQGTALEKDHYFENRVLDHLHRFNADVGEGYISVRTIESLNFLRKHSDYPVGLMQKKRTPSEFISLVEENEIEYSQIRWKTFEDFHWDLLKETGTKITCFYADTESEWKFLMEKNPYGVLTNFPQDFRNFLNHVPE